MEGQLEFLNLDEELEVAIPEDGKVNLDTLCDHFKHINEDN